MLIRIALYQRFEEENKPWLQTRILDPNFIVYPMVAENQEGRDKTKDYDTETSHDKYLNELSNTLRLKLVIFIPKLSDPTKMDVKFKQGPSARTIYYYCPLLFHNNKYYQLFHSNVMEMYASRRLDPQMERRIPFCVDPTYDDFGGFFEEQKAPSDEHLNN